MPVAAFVAGFDAEGWCGRGGVSSYSYIAMLEVVTILRPTLRFTSKSLWT
jgi:hypothetical protein